MSRPRTESWTQGRRALEPRRRRGKLSAALVACGGFLALLFGTYAARNQIREEWYIHRLRSEDEAIRVEAARSLAELGSLRAVPTLVELVAEEEERFYRLLARPLFDPERREWRFPPLVRALHAAGPRARPLVEERIEEERRRQPPPRAVLHVLGAVIEAWRSPSIPVSVRAAAGP